MNRAAAALTLCLAATLTGCGASTANAPETTGALDSQETCSEQVKCIKTESGTIYGRLYSPVDETGDEPLVIISHGIGSSCEATTKDAERLAAAGVRAYVFDFRSGSMSSKSDALLANGAMMGMSVLTEKDDLEAVMDALLADGTAAAGQLYLMGESQGGMVSALAAAERAGDVAGLALFFPAFVIPDNARSEYASAVDVPEDAKALGMTVGQRYYDDVLGMDVWSEIAGYEGPVLLVHGDADPLVPVSYSEKAAETYADAELHVLPGAGHGFNGSDLDQACAWVAEFIKK